MRINIMNYQVLPGQFLHEVLGNKKINSINTIDILVESTINKCLTIKKF